MLRDQLNIQIREAMKARDQVKVSTLKLLANALHNEEIAKQRELTEEEELVIIKRQIKIREEAVEAFTNAGRTESAEKESQELSILKEYMPEQMSPEQIEEAVTRAIESLGATSPQDFGNVMKAAMADLKGQADGKIVSEIVRKKLTIN